MDQTTKWWVSVGRFLRFAYAPVTGWSDWVQILVAVLLAALGFLPKFPGNPLLYITGIALVFALVAGYRLQRRSDIASTRSIHAVGDGGSFAYLKVTNYGMRRELSADLLSLDGGTRGDQLGWGRKTAVSKAELNDGQHEYVLVAKVTREKSGLLIQPVSAKHPPAYSFWRSHRTIGDECEAVVRITASHGHRPVLVKAIIRPSVKDGHGHCVVVSQEVE
jgi:hypothetical protein